MTIKKISSKKGFTLVELIIVIAIISILAVTAFLLLTKRLAKARDASRSSNLANIENSLQISLTENSSLPKPDSYTLIYASGTTNVVGYQGYFGEGVKDSVGNINSAPKDGDDYFTYYLNADLNKYQLAGFMENEIAYNPNIVSAVDYASRYVNVRGDKLGLLTDINKSPLQSLGLTGLDISTGNTTYIAYMDNSANISGTGKQLFTYYYNRTKSLLNNKDVAKYDDSLVFYTDMENTLLSGTNFVMKDFSLNGNHGNCYNSGTLVSCGAGAGGPQFTQGKIGKAMQFDGNTTYISITSGASMLNRGSGVFSISTDFNLSLLDGKAILRIGYGCRTPGYQIYISDGKISVANRNGVSGAGSLFNSYASSNTKKLSVNTWYNLIVSSDGHIAKIFLDGKLLAQFTYSQIYSPVASMPLNIGASKGVCPTYGSYFNGTIDELRIYNRALSDIEINVLSDAN